MALKYDSRTGKPNINNVLKGSEKGKKRQEMSKASQKVKPNRDTRPPRRNDWIPQSEDDLEDGVYAASERIMPRGEQERRKIVQTVAEKIKAKAADGDAPPDEIEMVAGLRGAVVEVSSGLCRVEVDGRVLLCTLRGTLSAHETGYTNLVAVGDEVIISEDGALGGVVEQVLPRRSVLARPDVFLSHLKQIIVANVDQLLIVAAWREPHLWLELIDRYFITAERDDLTPILCVNKIDLAEDRAECVQLLEPYRQLGMEIIYTSAHTGEGILELREMLQGKSTVLAGMSGVGKSSLLSVVQPGLNLKTSAVGEFRGEGRHTTTQATLLRLENGGYVVDTPGIREFGLSGMAQSELVEFYPEIEELAGECRFNNCTHHQEPGCMVRTAVKHGEIAEWRYENYKKLYRVLGAE